MSESRSSHGWVAIERIGVCRTDVIAARTRLRSAQGAPGGLGVYGLRLDLVAALEAYSAAVDDLGAPQPRGLRAEIALLRGIGHRR